MKGRVMRIFVAAIFLPVLAVAGCATVSQMAATGGSRADGVVRLSFEAGLFDKIAIDETSALATARRRCSTWGYSDAEPFGGVTRQCNAMSTYGCTRWFITKEYQCLSSGSVTSINAGPPVSSAAARSPTPAMPTADPGDAPGTINLGGGVKLVPARTLSGYCIKAPSGYQGSGSVNRPAVTNARPICG